MTCVTRERHLVTWTGCLDRLNIRNHILSEAYRNNLNFHIFTKFWVGTGWGLVPVGTGTHLDEGDPYKYTSNCIKLFSHIIFKFLNTPFCPYHFWPIRTLNMTFYIHESLSMTHRFGSYSIATLCIDNSIFTLGICTARKWHAARFCWTIFYFIDNNFGRTIEINVIFPILWSISSSTTFQLKYHKVLPKIRLENGDRNLQIVVKNQSGFVNQDHHDILIL